MKGKKKDKNINTIKRESEIKRAFFLEIKNDYKMKYQNKMIRRSSWGLPQNNNGDKNQDLKISERVPYLPRGS